MSIPHLILLIDKSRFMIGNRMNETKKFVKSISSYNRVSVYGFDETCRPCENIDQLEPDGGTCIFKALEFIFGEMEKSLQNGEHLSLILIAHVEDSLGSFQEDFIQNCWTKLLKSQVVDGEFVLLGNGDGVAQQLKKIFGCSIIKDSELSNALSNISELHKISNTVRTKFEFISESLRTIRVSNEITENAVNKIKSELDDLNDACEPIREELQKIRQKFLTWRNSTIQFSIQLRADAVTTLEEYDECNNLIDKETMEMLEMKHTTTCLKDISSKQQKSLIQNEMDDIELRRMLIKNQKAESKIEEERIEIQKEIENALRIANNNSNKIKIMQDQEKQIGKKFRDCHIMIIESSKNLKDLHTKILSIEELIRDNIFYSSQTITDLTNVLTELDEYAVRAANNVPP